MAKDESRFGRRRSSRFGPRQSGKFKSGRGQRGVFSIGSSSFGTKNALPMNMRAGSFGSGRMGGGAGSLAAALAGQPQISVEGTPEVGPPPVTPPPFVDDTQSPRYVPPTFQPSPYIEPPQPPFRTSPLYPSFFPATSAPPKPRGRLPYY